MELIPVILLLDISGVPLFWFSFDANVYFRMEYWQDFRIHFLLAVVMAGNLTTTDSLNVEVRKLSMAQSL